MSTFELQRAVLLHCDEAATEVLRKSFKDTTVIDCRGLENLTLKEILNSECPKKEAPLTSGEVLCYVIFSGFENSYIGQIIKQIRQYLGRDLVFATTTESNMNWKMSDLLSELAEEHNYFVKARREKLDG
ncbi:hypothetical protein KU43_01630 [Mesotoga sp. SC_NapDC2]|uniref:DUF3783 domain-containing protein n=1 Tax=unclassified Mesotoga TaxID=1184398 RepID=UPI000D83C827|nr:DUF3783 domain-containing protein [Mesotoga sp. UBA5825]MDD3461573.1 DUF3783 domain-containing protein [Mesotoga sp.]PXF35414.1 hypothetical protein EU77_01695 [Mesotoga sp. SC_NapDC]RAM63246.1 hypothetical protein DS66_06460 [Mesotoga sp. SC_3PWM13N19]RIZ61612.1 hypothetical protein KU43_01630 [Mesotoga sp. SC_NapDC2]